MVRIKIIKGAKDLVIGLVLHMGWVEISHSFPLVCLRLSAKESAWSASLLHSPHLPQLIRGTIFRLL